MSFPVSISDRFASFRGQIVWFIFCCFGLVTPGWALTVAAYNVENYLVTDRMVEGVFRQAYPKPETEKAALRQVIAGISPDILAVEEMGPQPFLDEFQRDLKQAGQDFPFTVLLEGPDPDRHVAVLSKVPFKEVRPHARLETTYFGQKQTVKRGALEVIFATEAGDFSLFVIHLKSRHTERTADPESAIQRALEAEAVRDLVLSRYPDPVKGRFMICGDWNDTRGSRSIRAMQKRGDLALGEILRAADSHGEVWTHFWRREDTYSRIDYLLVSPALKPYVVGGCGRIYDGAGVPDASDHRPVFMKLNVTAKGK